MKAFILAAAGTALFAGSSVTASTMSLGESLARACFEAAEMRNATVATLQTCDRALLEEPLMTRDRVATYVNRGILRLASGNTRLASDDFDRALAMDPNEPDAWLNKGVLRLRAGDSAGALPMIARSIELKTRRPALAYYARAVANEDRGNVREAYADLVRARDLEPGWSVPAKELTRFQVRQR